MSQETLQDFAGVWIGELSELVKTITGSGPIKYLINWSRMYALWPVHITTACCSAEFGAMMGPRLDPERFGLHGRRPLLRLKVKQLDELKYPEENMR